MSAELSFEYAQSLVFFFWGILHPLILFLVLWKILYLRWSLQESWCFFLFRTQTSMRWLLSGIHTWSRLNVCCWLGLQQKSTYWQKSTWWGGSMQASHQSLSLYLGFTIKAKAHSGSGMTWISLTAIVACTLWFLKFNTSHWISLEG